MIESGRRSIGADADVAVRLAEIRSDLGRRDPESRALAITRSAALLAAVLSRAATEQLSPATLSATWLAYGQACEAAGGKRNVEEALRAYAAAIAACGGPVWAVREPAVRRALGLAWMNRGNALQARGGAVDLDAAVAAYDEAIAAFEPLLEAADDPGLRNSLGAAWLNRGRALQSQATAADLRAAIAAFDRAIATLSSLPLAAHRWYRINLAAARLNLANAALALVLASGGGGNHGREGWLATALAAARAACTDIAQIEDEDPVAAEVGLKARRVLACLLGEYLAAANVAATPAERRSWADEIGDAVDGGLQCARGWEARGVSGFRPLAARLFRLGVQLYRVHQPQFLGDFVLESLDPAHGVDARALAGEDELHATAQKALADACAELRTQHRIDLGSAATARLLQTLSDLEAAGRRLTELRPAR